MNGRELSKIVKKLQIIVPAMYPVSVGTKRGMVRGLSDNKKKRFF